MSVLSTVFRGRGEVGVHVLRCFGTRPAVHDATTKNRKLKFPLIEVFLLMLTDRRVLISNALQNKRLIRPCYSMGLHAYQC